MFFVPALTVSLATTQPTVNELQSDFDGAHLCPGTVDGREVWECETAFFISSYTKEAAQLDPGLTGADAVLRDDNTPDVAGRYDVAPGTIGEAREMSPCLVLAGMRGKGAVARHLRRGPTSLAAVLRKDAEVSPT